MEKEIIIQRDQLSKVIEKICKNKYSIGFHGIADSKAAKRELSIESIKEAIFDKGLEIKNHRTLLGTVAFNGFSSPNLINTNDYNETMSEEDFINNYNYGNTKNYILVALPKVLKNSSKEEIFLGSPVYNNQYDSGYTPGYQLTTFSDAFLPDYYEEKTNNLNPMFILGSFTILPDNKLKLILNKKHISLHNDIVPNEFFETKKDKIIRYLNFYGIKYLFNNNYDVNALISDFSNMNELCFGDYEDDSNELINKINNAEITEEEDIFYSFPFLYCETLLQFTKYYDKYKNIKEINSLEGNDKSVYK